MKIKHFAILSTLVLALFLGAPPARLHAQMLLNGSFENPATASYIGGSAGANWTQIGSGDDYIFNNADSGAGGGTTPYGSQYLEVLYQNDGASQTVTGFTIGQTYLFTLAAAPTSTSPATGQLYVTGGATAIQTFSLTQRTTGGNQSTPFPFQTVALAFTCTSNAAITLNLVNTSPSEPIAFDNAQLNAVPEPSAWALLGVGVAGLGVVTLRRRSAGRA